MRTQLQKMWPVKNMLIVMAALLSVAALTSIATNTHQETDSMHPASSFKLSTLPGATPLDPALLEKIELKTIERGKRYQPRTRHLLADGSAKYTNRLFLQSSPYLLQHAHNPVNWFPWGDEAFTLARQLNRPVLVSIGYSTCHWCHVMEEESFEDLEIAAYLNEHYIAIKVDREERPDVDAIYMSAVQAMTGRGGWPMTVWLTPDRKPFYGGTYFPARDGNRGASTGFLTLLQKLHEVYVQQPDKIAESSEQLTQLIRQSLQPHTSGSALPGGQLIPAVMQQFAGRFDAQYGGLEGAPKFPSSLPVRLMLRYYRRTGDRAMLDHAVLTLNKIASGGIHDQVGGGFHRYSTDERWLVPHFEKMLYDNALLAMAYLEAYQITDEPQFRLVTENILRYVQRDMTSAAGAFYSATDADTPTPDGRSEEGWFFTWTPGEIDQVLAPDAARLVKAHYHIEQGGNFEGRNILYAPDPLAVSAKRLKLSPEAAREQLAISVEKLYQARLQRPPPLRDEKILTAWNGLMISAYAKAGLVLAKPEYTRIATTAARFILDKLYHDGRLLHSFTAGTAHLNAYLDDYAFLIAALLDLYEASFDIQWLQDAIALDRILEVFYEDKKNGGFFMTSDDHENLLAREKPAYDGAEPSGNSVAILNLLRLQEFTDDDRYRQRAEKAFQAFASKLQSQPAALGEMLLALDFQLDRAKEIVIVTPEGKRQAAEPLLTEFRQSFQPNRILVVVEEGKELVRQSALIPLLEGKQSKQGEPIAYVCTQGICNLPTSDPAVFAKLIAVTEPLPLE